MTISTLNVVWIILFAIAVLFFAISTIVYMCAAHRSEAQAKAASEQLRAEQKRAIARYTPREGALPAEVHEQRRIRAQAFTGAREVYAGAFEWRSDGELVMVRPKNHPAIVFVFDANQADNVAWASGEGAPTHWAEVRDAPPHDRWMVSMLRAGLIPNVPDAVRDRILGASPRDEALNGD